MKKTTGKKIHSVLVDDLQHCIVTGSPEVAIHHVFNGANRSRSEAYGFIVPLRPDWHNMTPYSVHMNQEFDESLKRQAQETEKVNSFTNRHIINSNRWLSL